MAEAAKKEETPEQSIKRLQEQRKNETEEEAAQNDAPDGYVHDLTPFERAMLENITLKRVLLDKDQQDVVRAVRRRLEVPDHYDTAFDTLNVKVKVIPKNKPKGGE
jgi:hypothetical protein